ncbi:hypothetical protein [Actinomadura luteofluorescens]|uniref:hypothetical protein n=1 Tax=Actinomadura luteofluorescens TaxID=46163 RepID=UPI003D9343C5
MTTWTSDELDRIGDATELDLQSARDDGTLRDPVDLLLRRAGRLPRQLDARAFPRTGQASGMAVP